MIIINNENSISMYFIWTLFLFHENYFWVEFQWSFTSKTSFLYFVPSEMKFYALNHKYG